MLRIGMDHNSVFGRIVLAKLKRIAKHERHPEPKAASMAAQTIGDYAYAVAPNTSRLQGIPVSDTILA
jgi:hypothetical protein